jgi:hypothetical protein
MTLRRCSLAPLRVVCLAVLALATGACSDGARGNDGPVTDASFSEASCAAMTTEQSVAAFDALVHQLEENRSEALPANADELSGFGSYLYYEDTTNLTPVLHRVASDGTQSVAYTFTIGSGDFANFRASDSLVVTAQPSGSGVEYRAYDPAQPNQLVGSAMLPAPGSGVRWFAYAVDGNSVYIMDTDTPGATTLLRWVPGQSATPTTVTTLESAGATVGEFYDFGVSGNSLVFIESGRVWQMDLAANRAVWLHNMVQAEGQVNFDESGVLFDTAMGLYFYSATSQMITDVAATIHDSPFRISCVYTTPHYFEEGFARWGAWVVYGGNSGIFAFNLQTQEIRPVLLDTNEAPYIRYRDPVVLANGVLFTTGLTSQTGSVGADGPVYRVDLTRVLQ